MRWAPRLLLLGALLLPARARADRDWHAGVNLRSDLGVHQLRLDGGVRLGALDAILVVDPLYFTDGELDLDALVRWEPSRPGWALAGGWRAVFFELANGHRVHEQLLLGATAPLPMPFAGVRAQLGLELAIVLVRHGAGLGTEGLAADSRLGDLLQPGMFLRFELARGF
jgi:hypothetical protein